MILRPHTEEPSMHSTPGMVSQMKVAYHMIASGTAPVSDRGTA